ncbi:MULTISPECIES: DMT family transporter [unclassified Rhizobium]|uniref:DMT family transporter n=1 Tax=unclassified Rhizobium TaxID=2613769 RepID=UPI0016164595|nr:MULTISPECIES: DMT family transporter [unclassified Rhizobium]MBB3382637.1 drug/metabolite transporter (DMT)-like permease [Rhizobium sp. BK098]MBB3614338.1 drug/metabolite transporter (DMT)-like permease [Rhizobium sp. BK609]MBB3680276.1 drug/metabolite transporter (DMT)-like permease [Rhizobium sp. BK612]
MFSHLSDHKKGLLLTTLGGLALSMDIPLIRLSSGEVWSVLSARSLATIVVALAALFVIHRVTGSLKTVLPGWLGIPVGFFYGLTTITFLLAVYYTKAANVVFIIALNPMFTALLSWIFLKERPALSTFITMAVMILGVGLIVGDGMEAGHLLGDALSVLASLSIACAITISRASGRDMGFASLLAAVIPAAVGLYHMVPSGFSIDHPGWILFDGAVLMPLSFWCLATGTRFLSAPEVAMFYLLETILAPIWVWLIFSEAPANMTLAGGAILILALAAHSLWQARVKARAAIIAQTLAP